MKIKSIVFLVLIFQLLFQTSGLAAVLDGTTLKEVSIQDQLKNIKPGTIVVIGENHNQKLHQQQQLQVMSLLRTYGHKVHTGLEFIYYPYQNKLNDYRALLISEQDFLRDIGWGGDGFEFYRDQILFPDLSKGEHAWALNLPRLITGKIAQTGLSSLTVDETKLLPPNFQSGRETYKKRFLKSMPHLTPDKVDNYFISQSAWDDTMAWKAIQAINQFPDSVLVVTAGDFHVAFGGGLPDRIRSRGFDLVYTISLFNSEGLSKEELLAEISPDNNEPRADLIWVTENPASKFLTYPESSR